MYHALRRIMSSATIFGYFLEVVPVTCLVGMVYAIFRLRALRRSDRIAWGAEIMQFLFVCYLTGLLGLLLLPPGFWCSIFDGIAFGWWSEVKPVFGLGGVNLSPTLLQCLRGELTLGSWVKEMLLGNILMFLPLGFFLPFVTRRVNRKNIFAFALCVPLVLESLQIVPGRSFDIDDLLCNFLGITVGYFAAAAVRRIGKRPAHTPLGKDHYGTPDRKQ